MSQFPMVPPGITSISGTSVGITDGAGAGVGIGDRADNVVVRFDQHIKRSGGRTESAANRYR